MSSAMRGSLAESCSSAVAIESGGSIYPESVADASPRAQRNLLWQLGSGTLHCAAMKKAAGLLLCFWMIASAALAQEAFKNVTNTRTTTDEYTPRHIFNVYGSYVFGSDLEFDDDDFD